MKTKDFVCSYCGQTFDKEHIHEFDGEHFCEDCLNQKTVVCDNCQERIWRYDAQITSYTNLCQHCFDNYYTNCEDCGALIHNDDAYYEDDDDYPHCHDCYEKRMIYPIKGYNYKPEPRFYGSGNLFLGVELEVDKGGENDDNAQVLLSIANTIGERIYCKHDGSLEEGFEIVSHPMTLGYHTNEMNWNKVFNEAISMGYRSHQTQTCGLHIHVSKNAFGDTYDEQEQTVGRVVFFVEKHWNEIVKFSRRTIDNLNRWSARYATISSTDEETYTKAKNRYLGRYVAVNLENSNTIEFRIFRGSLNHNTFLATLQFVDEICNLAINMSNGEIEGMSWSDFVSRISPCKAELIDYLRQKRLYVNEASNETEEM